MRTGASVLARTLAVAPARLGRRAKLAPLAQLVAAVALAAILLLSAQASADAPPASAQVVLTDSWDMPIALNMIPAGRPALFLVCDPSQLKCREGAVLFDSQAARIEAAGVKPACILVASVEAAREAARRMDLAVPVYIDAGRTVPAGLLGQDVMPALVLLDGEGGLKKVAMGGGEAMDANITAMLEPRSGRWKLLVLIPLVALAIIPFIVD